MKPNEVKAWLDAHEMYPAALAKRLGVSRSLVYAWIWGDRVIPAWLPLALAQLEIEVKHG